MEKKETLRRIQLKKSGELTLSDYADLCDEMNKISESLSNKLKNLEVSNLIKNIERIIGQIDIISKLIDKAACPSKFDLTSIDDEAATKITLLGYVLLHSATELEKKIVDVVSSYLTD